MKLAIVGDPPEVLVYAMMNVFPWLMLTHFIQVTVGVVPATSVLSPKQRNRSNKTCTLDKMMTNTIQIRTIEHTSRTSFLSVRIDRKLSNRSSLDGTERLTSEWQGYSVPSQNLRACAINVWPYHVSVLKSTLRSFLRQGLSDKQGQMRCIYGYYSTSEMSKTKIR